MKLLDDYLKLQQEIYDYFGYVEDWVAIPIDDRREFYWSLDEDSVFYAKSKKFAKNRDGDDNDGYEDEIYRQRFLPKWVYEGKDYTMICVDTHVDGNKFLAIYDNKRRVG